MAKLHELLAVKDSLRNQAETCRADLKNTFEKKTNHFFKRIVTFKSLKEGEPDKVEDQLGLQTTVSKELAWIGEKVAKSIDVAFQIDVANTTASSDVVLDDGMVILTKVPSTALLQLQKRLDEIQDLVKNIPTLDPSKGFVPDADEGTGIYRARDLVRPRTQKQFDYIVMQAPTDKHPAQIKELNIDKLVGETLTQEWCSMITVAEKSAMIDRVEELTRAVKRAMASANEAEVNTKSARVGKRLLDYVFGEAG